MPLFRGSPAKVVPSPAGLPQRINRIAHYALSATAFANAHRVTSEHLQRPRRTAAIATHDVQ